MRCLVVQHVEAEGPCRILDHLIAAGIEVDLRQPADGAGLPRSLDGFDGLVVMGGPMSARSDDGFPSRRSEIALLGEGITRNLPILGVCLGAQLLAVAGGGAAVPGRGGPEIGWGSIHLTDAAADDPLFQGLSGDLLALHWHGETVDLPSNALLIGSNERYVNQVFRIGSRAWGVQCHLEVDRTAVGKFCSAFADELEAAGVAATEMTASADAALDEIAPVRDVVFTRFASLVALGAPDH